MRRPGSLQRRLLLAVTGAVAALWLATAVFTYWEAQHELDELLDAHLAQAASLLVAQAAPVDGDLRHDDAQDGRHPDPDDGLVDAPRLHQYARRVAFQVWHEGQLVMRSPTAPDTPLSTLASGFENRTLADETWRLFATHGRENDVQVYVAERISSRSDILWGMMRGLLGPLLLALPLIALAVWGTVWRTLRPLGQLSRALAARQPGDLAPITLPEAPPAELEPALRELNELLARIGTLIDGERRFTADAAHELRTPIAAIRAQAQVALAATADDERRHALQATLQGCDRANHLVQQLLTLSRVEAAHHASGPGTPPPPLVDLAGVARAVVGELAPTAVARQQTLALEAPDTLPLPGNDTLLRVLLRNLVDNALRYSPEGAEVQVRLTQDSDGTHLEVEDSGPGLEEAELARLGERFFRKLGTGVSGSGLGWSIVRRIAAAQHAQLQVTRSTRLGGLWVRVDWAPPSPI
ncbi:sensor histidine kinase N-terminal domain-containing protein [Ideonella sp. B7]|nr:sensor histidine kinase N-terminal domain-containing protein [Ideonella benzenivorans]